jgi:hypothetical protein
MIYESKSSEYSQDVAITSDQGYEYRSEHELFGLPLIHITRGRDPYTGRRRVSKGIIAIGEVAVGLIAVGGVALGGIAIGGLGIGLLAIGGLALGVMALGAVSFGLYFAMGTVALSLMYAIGWSALAPNFIDANGIGGSFLPMIREWLAWVALT